MTAMERSRILRRAVDILRDRNDELAAIETADTGKPLSETRSVDIVTGADVLEYYAGLIPALEGQQIPLRGSAFVYTAVSHWAWLPVLVPGTIPFRSLCGNLHRRWRRATL